MKDQFQDYAPAQESSDRQPITEDGAPEGQGDSIHIPAEFLMGKEYKEGDTITLKVVAADEDGVEVENATEASDDKGEGGEGEGMSANDEMDMMEKRGGSYG